MNQRTDFTSHKYNSVHNTHNTQNTQTIDDNLSIPVVRQLLFNVFKFKIIDHDLLKSIIQECVPMGTKLASMKGYHTFQHYHFKELVIHRYHHITHKKKFY